MTMDTFTRLIHEHAEAQRYNELALFAILHQGVLTGIYNGAEEFVWVETAQCEHILDPTLGGYVATKMASHIQLVPTWREAIARATPFYDTVVDIAPWVRTQWIDFKSEDWYAAHTEDWQTAHGIPSMVLCLAQSGDRVSAFSEFLKTIEAILRHQDPSSGFWWLISDSVEDAGLAISLASTRARAAEAEVTTLREHLR